MITDFISVNEWCYKDGVFLATKGRESNLKLSFFLLLSLIELNDEMHPDPFRCKLRVYKRAENLKDIIPAESPLSFPLVQHW